MIYFIKAGRFIKIGTSATQAHFDRRVKDLQCGNPHRLVVLATVSGGHKTERLLHQAIPNRAHGEWFGRSDALDDLVSAIKNSGDPDKVVDDFLAAEISKREAWLLRFKGKWPEYDRLFREKVALLYRVMVMLHGLETVATITGSSIGSVRNAAKGAFIPKPVPLLKFQAAFFPTGDLRDVEAAINVMIARAERIAA